MIALLSTDGNDGVAALVEGIGQKKFQLSELVAAQLDSSSRIVSLDEQTDVMIGKRLQDAGGTT